MRKVNAGILVLALFFNWGLDYGCQNHLRKKITSSMDVYPPVACYYHTPVAQTSDLSGNWNL